MGPIVARGCILALSASIAIGICNSIANGTPAAKRVQAERSYREAGRATPSISTRFESAPAQTLFGVWEGEIEDPQRPIVLTLDFEGRHVSFSGGAQTNLTQLKLAGKGISFAIALGSQILEFAGETNDYRITGNVKAGNQRIPFWLELLPTRPKPLNRSDAWRQDIDVVISRFLRYDRSFNDSQREVARARLQALRARVGRMSDQAIMVELARAVALSGNAHTRLYLMRNRTEMRRVPLRVWWFGRELRVIRAASEYSDLVGCRVKRIGASSAVVALSRVRGIKAGNSSWQRYMSSYFLTSPDLLFGAGVTSDPNHLPLTVNCDGRERESDVVPLPLHRSKVSVEAWWDLAPAYKDPNIEFKSALAAAKAPLYLRHPDQNYWVEYLSDSAIIYIQYNRSEQMPTESMSDFINRVTTLFDAHQIKGFIIDVRFNTGGDLGVGRPLVETLAPRLKNVPVVVLTGRATFSAGISHAAQWKQLTNASVVGEEIGDGIDLWGEGGNIVLPNSGLTVHYANGFHKYSQKEYPAYKPYYAELHVATLMPDRVVEPTWSEYANGADPVLRSAIELINGRKYK